MGRVNELKVFFWAKMCLKINAPGKIHDPGNLGIADIF